MVGLEVLLIDDLGQRRQCVETVLRFLECNVTGIVCNDLQAVEAEIFDYDVIFLGGNVEQQAALIQNVNARLGDKPIILLIDKGQQAFINAQQYKLTAVLEWPTTYAVLSEIFQKFAPQSAGLKRTQLNKGLSGQSKAIQKIRDLINQVAKSDASVLILGESGTGKEVVAQALHRSSSRRDKPFVPVNCGAIPSELLESELFGHEKGAFTGALASRQGRFEMAEGGTLFLDEIGDMPMAMQVKLLRVLQERCFERVGSNKTIHCDVRIVAATHRQLEQEIIEKRFREDLYYRLNVFPIELPALRDRVEDIPFLINDLVARMAAANRGTLRLTQKAIAVLMQHHWPGNIRELSNLVERLAIIKPDGLIDAADLPEKFHAYEAPESLAFVIPEPKVNGNDLVEPQPHVKSISGTVGGIQLPEQGIDLKEYLTDLENELIRQALEECNGVVAHAAKLLNMRRTTLVEKLRKVDT
jgi:sigma-54 dependent transcriptional regulator, flagellar regulatory protein